MRTRKVQIPNLQNATYDNKPAPGWTSYTVFKCSRCRRIRQSVNAFTTGYGVNKSGRKLCFQCCGELDQKAMLKTGKACLYIVKRDGRYHVTNWPGTIDISRVSVRHGSHNIGRTRLDAWFSFAGKNWHGVQIGEWNQILRCKQVKG